MTIQIDVHIHQAGGEDLHKIKESLTKLIQQGVRIMATLDDVLKDVTEEKTDIAGLSTFIQGLKQQLADALSGANLPAPVQAKVDAIFAAAESNKADIAAALAANVPT